MAGRPPKQSLDFSGWSVSIFDNDPKIDKLLDAQGCTGFVIYFFLCQRAYGTHGYYFPWSYDDAATTAKKIGGGAGSEAVINTVNLCLHIGLFNKNLYDRHGILTSRGVQRGYLPVILTRTNKSVIREYWLLNEEESVGLNFRALKSNLSSKNTNYDPSKSNYDPLIVEDSIAEESIAEQSKDTTTDAVFGEAIGYYMDKIRDTTNGMTIEKMKEYAETMSADVIKRAIDKAIVAKVPKWNYINTILSDWQKHNVHTMDDVAREQEEYERSKSSGKSRGNKRGDNTKTVRDDAAWNVPTTRL